MSVRSCLSAIFIVLFVAGCASVSVSGKKSNDFNGKVDLVQVIIVDFWQSKADPTVSSEFARNDPEVSKGIDAFMKYFASRCSHRWTQIFSINEKPFRITRASIIQPGNFKLDSDFVLLIRPSSVIYNHGMNNVTFKATMNARGNATPMWEGVIDFTPTHSRENGMDDSIDEFGKVLLEKLRADGVITLPFAEIKMPPKELNTASADAVQN